MEPFDPATDPRNHPVVIASQLAELHTITVAGFAKLDGRLEKVEGKVDALDTRLIKVEVKQETADTVIAKTWLPDNDLVKVLGAVALIVLAALGGNAAPPL
jgi:hypothetical protein